MKNPWLPVVIWMGVIFWFSHQDGTESGLQSGWILNGLVEMGIPEGWVRSSWFIWMLRKSAHFTEYFVLGWLLRRTGLQALKAILFLIVWAMLDEYHQSFVPGRSAALMDVGIDSAGGMAGYLVRVISPSKSIQKH